MPLPSQSSSLLICLLCALLPFGCVQKSTLTTADTVKTTEAPTIIDIQTESLRSWDEDAPFRLIGRLGEPIGTCLIVQGDVLEVDAEGDTLLIRVQCVNGSRLVAPVEISAWAIPDGRLDSLEVGQVCELDCYETGAFFGVPAEAEIPPGFHPKLGDYRFVSSLSICRVTPKAGIDCEKLKGDPEAQRKQNDVPFNQIPGVGVQTPYRMIGKLGLPLGTVVTLEGTIVEGFYKGFDQILLRVQRINGQPTQECLHISPTSFGARGYTDLGIPENTFGGTFTLVGYETGFYIGIPEECLSKLQMAIQTYAGHFFRTYFIAHESQEIAPIQFAPRDFEDQTALIEGAAVNDAAQPLIEGDGWRLLIDDTQPWPADIEGKKVEGYGIIRTTNTEGVWRLEGGWTRLVNLEDQVGRDVMLRASARNVEDHVAILNYRGAAVYVDGLSEPDLSQWKKRDWSPVIVRGRLEEAMLPDPRKPADSNNPTLKKCYIVRNASFEPLDKLLSPEYPPKSTSSFDR